MLYAEAAYFDGVPVAHVAAIDFAVRALMLAAGAFALWSIQRDVRAAWPRIVELWKDRNHDT